MSSYTPNALLGRLVGRELAIVAFVRDYLQLDFDGPLLTCEVWPTVRADTGHLGVADAGYRDALCSFIGEPVVSTTERTGTGLVVAFAAGAVVLHPRWDELAGPEIAMLSGFEDRAWMVWRPGEDSFEDLAEAPGG